MIKIIKLLGKNKKERIFKKASPTPIKMIDLHPEIRFNVSNT